jgi:DNA-binding response OmpR family regulator
MTKILVAEDNIESAEYIKTLLSMESYMVDVVHSGHDADLQLKGYQYDLIILDWNMPGKSGPEVCRNYRSANGVAPVLMLTANASENEKEFGLDSGADDYLTKPYSLKELLARIRALLRRTNRVVNSSLKVNDIELKPDSAQVFRKGVEIKLLPKEFALLEFFMRHPDQVFTSEQLLQRIWHTDSDVSTDALRSAMARLRKKLDAAGDEAVIETVHGFGFRLIVRRS